MDLAMNYQYRAFGVPGLGFKNGLAEDLVVAPYATVLASLVRLDLALHNFDAPTPPGSPAGTAITKPSTTRPVTCRRGGAAWWSRLSWRITRA